VPAAEEDRRRFTEWLADEDSDEPAPVWSAVAAELSVVGRFVRVRLDDKARKLRGKGTIAVAAEAEPLRFLVPRREGEEYAGHAATPRAGRPARPNRPPRRPATAGRSPACFVSKAIDAICSGLHHDHGRSG
jgi:hypothetical protein